MNATNENCVIFVHIPKTGGATLRRILRRQYPAADIYNIEAWRGNTIEKLQSLPEGERRRLRLVQGHGSFGLHRFLPQPATYITVLRQPVERVLSHYYYILGTPQHKFHSTLVEGQVSLEDFIRQGMRVGAVDNSQTRALSGAQMSGKRVGFRECTAEMLAEAKHNLHAYFSVVGVLENFDEMLILLRRTFGWRFFSYQVRNVTPNRPPRQAVPQSVLDLIADYNTLDAELHRFAAELCQAQIGRLGRTFRIELALFKLLNRWAHPKTYLRSLFHGHNPIYPG